jgi:hypothetical protein
VSWNPATYPYRCAYFPKRGGYNAPCAKVQSFPTADEARAHATKCPAGWTASLHQAVFSHSWAKDGRWVAFK